MQGLAICGICVDGMTARYHRRSWGLTPEYICQRHGIEHGEAACQQVPGAGVEETIGDFLVEAVTPLPWRLPSPSRKSSRLGQKMRTG
jgi:hypothetical protein